MSIIGRIPEVRVTVQVHDGSEPITYPSAFSAALALLVDLPNAVLNSLRLNTIPVMMRNRTLGIEHFEHAKGDKPAPPDTAALAAAVSTDDADIEEC